MERKIIGSSVNARVFRTTGTRQGGDGNDMTLESLSGRDRLWLAMQGGGNDGKEGKRVDQYLGIHCS